MRDELGAMGLRGAALDQLQQSNGEIVMKVTKSNRPSTDRQFAEGLTKHFPKGASWVIGQKKYSLTEILKLLERRIRAAQAVTTAKATWRGAIAQENALIADTESILAAVRQRVAITLDGSPDALADL